MLILTAYSLVGLIVAVVALLLLWIGLKQQISAVRAERTSNLG